MKIEIISIVFCLCLWWGEICQGQVISRPDSIVFSGVVVNQQTDEGLSEVHCRFGREKVAVSAFDGSFRLKVRQGDTVVFTHVGFKPYCIVIPDTLFQKEYLLGIFMSPDTTELAEVVIIQKYQNAWRRDMIYLQNSMSGILRQAIAPVKEMDADMNQRRMINEYARSVEMKGHVDVGFGIGTQSVDVYRLLKLRERLDARKSWLNPEEIEMLRKVYYIEKNRKSIN